MSDKKVRQEDIARALNISRTTVARAFSGQHVTEETRARVLATAKELGYVHNSIATTLAMKNSKTVYCFIIGTIDEGYCTQMKQGIDEVTNLWNGYNFKIRVFVTDINQQGNKRHEQLDQFYEAVNEQKPDGVIFSALCSENMRAVTAYCKQHDIPLMSLDLIYRDNALCHIGPDYYSFGEVSAAYLASLMKKNGKILALAYDDGYELSNLRMHGFYHWLETNCPQITCRRVAVDNISYGTYKRALEESLVGFEPDAIYAPYKMDHVIQALEKLRPQHSYIMISNGINPAIEQYLTSGVISGIISVNPYRLGVTAANNFFKYFYRSSEIVRGELDMGCDIYIRENYRRDTRLF